MLPSSRRLDIGFPTTGPTTPGSAAGPGSTVASVAGRLARQDPTRGSGAELDAVMRRLDEGLGTGRRFLLRVAMIALVSALGCTSARPDRTPPVSSTPVVSAPANVGGLTMVKPTSEIQRYCQAAANRLDRAVPCPSLLPADPYFPETCCLAKTIFLIQEVFQGPPSYVGMPDNDGPASDVGHLNIWSIPRGRLDAAGLGCTAHGRTGGTIEMMGRPAHWVTCPDNGDPPQDSGHVMLEWTEAGIVYAVSVHTDTRTNRLLALFLAQHLVFVEPSGED
jgi:hypothetical protein